MRNVKAFVSLLIAIICIVSCATGGFAAQEISIEPIETSVDVPLLEEVNITDINSQIENNEKKSNAQTETIFSEEKIESSVSPTITLEDSSSSPVASSISAPNVSSNISDNQDLELDDEAKKDNLALSETAPIPPDTISSMETNESSTTTEDNITESEEESVSSKDNSFISDTKDLSSETVPNSDSSMPNTVMKRDNTLAVIFGGISIIILLTAVIMCRKGDGIRKLSFLFFAISVISAVFSIAFAGHVFCKHEWSEATCVLPQSCILCGKKAGKALGHDFVFEEVLKESSCTEEGIDLYVCYRCGEKKEEITSKKEHVQGTVETTKVASYNSAGTKSYYCRNCNEIYKIEFYELSDSEKEEAFKNSCYRYSYDTLARYPDRYRGANVKLAGEVVQVMEDEDSVQYRINVTQDKIGSSSPSYFYDDTILVVDNRTSGGRILEGDIVALYGVMAGNCTYTTVLGASKTVPLMSAKYISRIRDRQYDTI